MANGDVVVAGTERQRLVLANILSSNSVVFLDGCGYYNFQENGEGFARESYRCDRKTGMKRDLVTKQLFAFSELERLLGHDCICTIPEVNEEIGCLVEEIIPDKQDFYVNRRVESTRYADRQCIEVVDKSIERLDLLRESGERIMGIARAKDVAKCAEMDIVPYKFNALLGMIKLLGKELGLKKETSRPDSDTDERLVAHTYYASMFSHKKPLLLTGDGDIVRLVQTTPGLMAYGKFAPHNELFRQCLKGNPFLLFFNDNRDCGEYVVTADSHEVEFGGSFWRKNVPQFFNT